MTKRTTERIRVWMVQFRFRLEQPWSTYVDRTEIEIDKDRAIKQFNEKYWNRLHRDDETYEELERLGRARCVPIYVPE